MARVTASSREVVAATRKVSLSLERWRAVFAKRWGLAGNDSVVMSHLIAAGGTLTPRDLAHLMNITTGSMTVMLDRLEKIDFIRRDPNPDDRRSVRITLTDEGVSALADTQTLLARQVEHAFDPEIRARLAHCLTELADLIATASEALEEEGVQVAPLR